MSKHVRIDISLVDKDIVGAYVQKDGVTIYLALGKGSTEGEILDAISRNACDAYRIAKEIEEKT